MKEALERMKKLLEPVFIYDLAALLIDEAPSEVMETFGLQEFVYGKGEYWYLSLKDEDKAESYYGALSLLRSVAETSQGRYGYLDDSKTLVPFGLLVITCDKYGLRSISCSEWESVLDNYLKKDKRHLCKTPPSVRSLTISGI